VGTDGPAHTQGAAPSVPTGAAASDRPESAACSGAGSTFPLHPSSESARSIDDALTKFIFS
jgi:hypothetical protein